jgi:hypothetical protein
VGCIGAFGRTDFREDLPKVDVPALPRRAPSLQCFHSPSHNSIGLRTSAAYPLGFVSGRGPGTTTRAIRRVGFKA